MVPGPLERHITGPSIRSWETAKAFQAAGHRVTAAAHVGAPLLRDGIRVVPASRRRVIGELARHDVIHGPLLPPYAMALLGVRRCLSMADLYDPGELERGAVSGPAMRRAAARHLLARRIHLSWADVVLSANERQAERTRRELEQIARHDGGPRLLTVPMGVHDPPPASDRRPLREHFPAIGPSDPVVLWWGNIWRWLDGESAIEAIALLARRRPDVRLVVTAGSPADRGTDPMNATDEARELARRRGLLDRHVFFLDHWIPYEERHHYLGEADVGLTLHGDAAEASLAARFRYMDYLWTGLPCVLSAGDEGGEQLAAAGAARLVPPHDPAATAAALEELLGDPRRLLAARRGCAALAERYRWSRVLAPVVACAEEMAPGPRSAGRLARAAGEAGRYYAAVTGHALLDRGIARRELRAPAVPRAVHSTSP
jgi:glycosyltransferase involved in cell wall biosynthesis